jgi:hypothetical protein
MMLSTYNVKSEQEIFEEPDDMVLGAYSLKCLCKDGAWVDMGYTAIA